MANPRIAKMQDQIQEIVAQMLERRVKDPRLGFVTITDVRVTGDAREATVFYTVLGPESDLKRTAIALESAKGLLRSTVGKKLGMKFVPTLSFIPDATAEIAKDIEDAVLRARTMDEELARSREGAQFAGDADPYRKRDEDLDEDDAADLAVAADADPYGTPEEVEDE